MAEKVIKTRILLKIDTYENWMKSSLILKKGEVAIYDASTNKAITKSDLDAAVAGLSGAVHFIGVKESLPASGNKDRRRSSYFF